MNATKNLLGAALAYQEADWNVIPLVGKKPPPGLRWSERITEPADVEMIKEWFQKYGTDITGIGMITGIDEDICVLDLEAEDNPTNHELPDTVNSRSGGGGWHYYFKIPSSYDKDYLPTVDLRKHGIVGELRCDKALITLPPSVHPNGKKYEWVKPLTRENLAELPQWLLELGDKPKHEPADWKEIMQGANQGERNTKTVSIAGKLLHSLPAKDWNKVALPLIISWNEQMNHPPLNKAELMNIYRSLSKNVKSGQPATEKKKRTLYSVSTVLELPEVERPKFLIQGLLPEKGITAMSGHPGCGKSWIMLEMAKSIALGEPFLNRYNTRQGNVLIIDEESGIWEMRRRLELLRYPENTPVHFYSQTSFKVDGDDDLEELLRTVSDNDIKLIVIDPFAAIHSGVENSAEEAQSVMHRLQSFNDVGASVLFIHHHRKTGVGNSGQSLRGSSAFSGRLDSHITVERTNETETTHSIGIQHVKSRRGKNMEPFQVTMLQESPNDAIQLEATGGAGGKVVKKDVAKGVIVELLKIAPHHRKQIIEEVQNEVEVGARNITDALKDLSTDKIIESKHTKKGNLYTLVKERTNDY